MPEMQEQFPAWPWLAGMPEMQEQFPAWSWMASRGSSIAATSAMLQGMAWFVYLIECTDGSIYTGIAVDVDTRYAKHVAGKGARYTRSHPPQRLLAAFEHPDRSSASVAEHRIKQLTPTQKRALCRVAAPARKRRPR